MDANVKQALTRHYNTHEELRDILAEEILAQPVVNKALRTYMGEVAYQKLAAAVMSCDHAAATAEPHLQ